MFLQKCQDHFGSRGVGGRILLSYGHECRVEFADLVARMFAAKTMPAPHRGASDFGIIEAPGFAISGLSESKRDKIGGSR